MLLILWWGYARLSQLSQSHLHQVAFPAAWLACTAETASRDSDCIGANIKKWTFRRSVVIATYHFCWLLSTSLCMQLTMLLTGNLLWLKGKQEVDLLDLCNLCRLRHLQIPHTSTRTCKEAANPRLFCVLKKGFARLEKSWNLLPTARSNHRTLGGPWPLRKAAILLDSLIKRIPMLGRRDRRANVQTDHLIFRLYKTPPEVIHKACA